jgi:hypothetical protein
MNDLSGKRFGRIVAINGFRKKGRTYWKCQCDCGKEKDISAQSLVNGATKSCGCLNSEIAKKTRTTHGDSKKRLYVIYSGMKTRCYNQNDDNYKKYGARGITICDEWLNDYEAFKKWALKNGYGDDLSIDRIKNERGYSPDNCRWANNKTQSRNKRDSVMITHEGKTKNLRDWAEIKGINPVTIYMRLKKGYSVEKALGNHSLKTGRKIHN